MRAVQVLLLITFQAAVLFLSAGRLDWSWAWVYIGLYLLAALVTGAFLLRYSPETVAERAGAGAGMKDWDKVVGGLFALTYFVILLLVAGLDHRLGWTASLAPGLHLAGAALFALGYALLSWAMISNAYFATVVRIQDDRGHTVCTSGPYRLARHPGYLGAIIQSLSLPLLLGSWWAFLPAGLAVLLLLARTALEDRTLHHELPGYDQYAARVRYCLLPGLW
jgi:protein-S-isoprenylcysteine O-methyltransferase Ste14